MLQLKYNQDFTEIQLDIPYWKEETDIPAKIKQYIIDTSNKRVIYETSTESFYCGKCICRLDKNNYCPNCHIAHKTYDTDTLEYDENKDITIVYQISPNQKYLLNTTCNYLIFDIVENDTWLYFIEEEIAYDNPFYTKPYKTSKVKIHPEKSYLIEQKGITNLKTNTYTSFSFLAECQKEVEEIPYRIRKKISSSSTYKIFDEIKFIEYNAYLYLDNLVDLKNTVYKYSKIWQLADYLKEQPTFNMVELIFNPLYYPSFEYLINYKLYNLAWHVPHWFNKGKNFKELFGVEKKYLPFMAECNIDEEELEVLRIYPTTDYNLLKYFSGWIEDLKHLIINYNLDLQVLKKYLQNSKQTPQHISDYIDYIYMVEELGLDLKDKKILYPKNLREAHDNLFNQIEIIENPILDKKINNLAHALAFNIYEDKNYIIYPASSIKDLVEESRQQKNCVRTYCERMANNESQIYFLRKKSEPNQSLVTIEVRDKKIVQARIKYNELPTDELNEILHKWEKTLIPVTTENE